MLQHKYVLFLLVMILSATAFADRATDEVAILKTLGNVKAESITPSAIEGLYEIVIGTRILYISEDGRHMIDGDIIDMRTRTSLTEPVRRKIQLKALEALGEDQMIVFKPEVVKHTVTVFTDIDCGYCRKLHSEIDQYLAEGIAVRYLMYPRAGKDSDSYNKAVSVWCSKDRNASLTLSKAGKEIEAKNCTNPVNDHMALAQVLGLQGTPMIVLENGRINSGYLPAKQLLEQLDNP